MVIESKKGPAMHHRAMVNLCSIRYNTLRTHCAPTEINERMHKLAVLLALLAELVPEARVYSTYVWVGSGSSMRRVRLSRVCVALLTGTEQSLCDALVTLVPNPCTCTPHSCACLC